MMNDALVIEILITISLVSIAILGVYWGLLYPVFRHVISDGIERNFDEFCLLTLDKETNITLRDGLCQHLREFFDGATRAGMPGVWISKVPFSSDEVKRRKLALQKLTLEMKDADDRLVTLVSETCWGLSSLHLLQRPIIILKLAPIAVIALFMKRQKTILESWQKEFAEEEWARAGQGTVAIG